MEGRLSDTGGGGKEKVREDFLEEMTNDPLHGDDELEEQQAVLLDRVQSMRGKCMR